VRLKTFLEMRGADSGPWNTLCALPAFWVGLLYDNTALDAAWDLVKDWTEEEREALRRGAAKTGLKTPFRDRTLQDIAREVLAISREGLNVRKRLNGHGENEALFLDDLDEIAKTGRTRAESLIARFNGEWGGSIEPVFTECAY
jgi:glutamate--cysteine ligase